MSHLGTRKDAKSFEAKCTARGKHPQVCLGGRSGESPRKNQHRSFPSVCSPFLLVTLSGREPRGLAVAPVVDMGSTNEQSSASSSASLRSSFC